LPKEGESNLTHSRGKEWGKNTLWLLKWGAARRPPVLGMERRAEGEKKEEKSLKSQKREKKKSKPGI